jgi:hypothetical protein
MKEYIYLAGLEVQFYNEEHLTNFIISQCVSEEFAKLGYNNSRLEFVDGKFVKYEFIDEGLPTKTLELQPELLGLPLPNYKPQTPKLISFAENGLHQMGGEYPSNFKEPKHNAISPFQYIGKISKQDALFTWLPFDLHICYPIYLHCDEIFFDYTNPEKPTIINIEQVDNEHSNFEPHINKNSTIIFEKALFEFKESMSFFNEDGNGFGHAGLPCYSQTNHLPKSPTTGKLMQFVCQLRGGVKMKTCDIAVTEEYYKKDLEALNFWSDASLMVYIEPETTIVCCLISH